MKCIGKNCKYCKDDMRDAPDYCGLIAVINDIFKLVKLPKMNFIFWYSNDFVECPFSDFDICRENNLDWSEVYELNKVIKNDSLFNSTITPNVYCNSINLFKGGSNK